MMPLRVAQHLSQLHNLACRIQLDAGSLLIKQGIVKPDANWTPDWPSDLLSYAVKLERRMAIIGAGYMAQALHDVVQQAAKNRWDVDARTCFPDNWGRDGHVTVYMYSAWSQRIRELALPEVQKLLDEDNAERLKKYEEFRALCELGTASRTT